jgi:hypothetical protein
LSWSTFITFKIDIHAVTIIQLLNETIIAATNDKQSDGIFEAGLKMAYVDNCKALESRLDFLLSF